MTGAGLAPSLAAGEEILIAAAAAARSWIEGRGTHRLRSD